MSKSFEVLAKKNTFKICVLSGPYLSNYIFQKSSNLFTVLAKSLSLCNVRINFSKCQILVVFEHFLQFWFSKLFFFLTCRNLKLFFPINILTEVVQQKIKIRICPKILKVWPKKPLLKFVFCPVHISVTMHL